jgi:hypothetical protein
VGDVARTEVLARGGDDEVGKGHCE